MFVGSVYGEVSVGIGTIIGGEGGRKLSKKHKGGSHKGKRTVHDKKTGQFVSKRSSSGGTLGPGLGQLEECKNNIDLVFYLDVRGRLAWVIRHETISLRIGSCSIKEGCQWEFSPSHSGGWGGGAGARAELVGGAEVPASIVIN